MLHLLYCTRHGWRLNKTDQTLRDDTYSVKLSGYLLSMHKFPSKPVKQVQSKVLIPVGVQIPPFAQGLGSQSEAVLDEQKESNKWHVRCGLIDYTVIAPNIDKYQLWGSAVLFNMNQRDQYVCDAGLSLYIFHKLLKHHTNSFFSPTQELHWSLILIPFEHFKLELPVISLSITM